MSARRSEAELRALMETIARRLLGDPNPRHSTKTELRWGTNGSMSVDLIKGTFFDHEADDGGGVLKLIERQELLDRAGAWRWLDTEYPAAPQLPAPKPNGHDRGGYITATYPYVDEVGTLLSEVVRKASPKRFRQRRPDPNAEDGWEWSATGVRPVPYRLPALLAAIAEGRTIWIVEGEKDVDRLRAMGLAATTNLGGAGKWRPELTSFFVGVDVVVVADNDPQKRDEKTGELKWHADGSPVLVGQDHAAAVARALAPVAKRVRLLDLGKAWAECPVKGDASDYLDAGHTAADLEALAIGLEIIGKPSLLPGSFTLNSLVTPPPPRLWHVPDLIPAGTVTMLGGDGGVGKSILALQLAIAGALGLRWLGQTVGAGEVLDLSAEDDRDEVHRRSDQIATFYGVTLPEVVGVTVWSLADEDALLFTAGPGEVLAPTDRWRLLQQFVGDVRPVLVILDSLADVYGANENDRGQVRQFVRNLRSLKTTIVLLAHPSLTGLATGSGLSGNTAWNNSVRSRLYFSAPTAEDGGASEPGLRTLAVKKANYTQAGAELRVRYVAGAFAADDVGVTSALDRQISAGRVDEQFLQLLDAYKAEGRTVSHLPGRNYGPTLFAGDPRARGTTMKGFQGAMNRLFAANAIRVGQWGPASRRISFIERLP
jgi:RecA-family ATPase